MTENECKRERGSTVVRAKGKMKTEHKSWQEQEMREGKRKRERKKERRDRKRRKRRRMRRRRNECGGNGLQRPRRPFT